MKKTILDFHPDEFILIKQLYLEGYSPHQIAYITNSTFQEIIYILNELPLNIDIKSLISYATLTDNQIIVISDTHFGSKYENLDYLREVYKFAKEHHIHTILHGGDLIHSTRTNVSNAYLNEIKQLEHVITDYPYDQDITSYIVLGNHDLNTLKKSREYYDILDSRSDFKLLGFKRAYLTWLKSFITLYHKTTKYQIPIPHFECDLTLKGHSHRLSIPSNSVINLPTLSDDGTMLQGNVTSGFLVLTNDGVNITVDSYYFDNYLEYEGKILTKSLK